MVELIFLAGFVLLCTLAYRYWNSCLVFLIRRFPFLTAVPFSGDAIQSEDSRLNILDRTRETEQKAKIERSIRAMEARKILGKTAADKVPNHYPLPSTIFPKDPVDVTNEAVVKAALLNGLASHNRLATSAPPANMRKSHLEQLEYFSYSFQQNEQFREPFRVRWNNPASGALETVDPDEIVQKLSTVSGAPTIVFLTGSIGIGKSTLAAIIQGRLLRKPSTIGGDVKNIVIPIDFDSLFGSGLGMDKEVTDASMAMFVLSEIRKHASAGESTLSEHLAKTKSRYIFIFDNLDLAYSEFCKRFIEGEQEVQGMIGSLRYLSCLRYLVRTMQDAFRSGGTVAPAALFCLRTDTMLLLSRAADRVGEPTLTERYAQYTVDDHDSVEVCKHFVSVIAKRGDLASALLANCQETASRDQIGSSFRDFVTYDAPRFRRYLNLSVQGMRTSIHSLCRYFALPGVPSSAVFEALRSDFRTEVLGYFNGRTDYSQNHTNITNIFLVNTEYRIKTAGAVIPKGLTIESYGHHHTFWLKYLIFSYISARSAGGTKSVRLEEVRSFFSRVGGFDHSLVSLIIYSLTEIEHGRLIRPKAHDDARLLGLTTRGLEFARDSIAVAWSPAYLSTVVEDAWLELPGAVTKELVPFGTNALWSDASFAEYLINKYEVVTRFLLCLEVTLGFERSCRKGLFSELDAIEELKPCFPRFSSLHASMKESFLKIAGELPLDHEKRVSSRIEAFSSRGRLAGEISILTAELSDLYNYTV